MPVRPGLIPLVCAGALLAAPATALAKPATPELIDQAEKAGQVDLAHADLYRAYAVGAPDRLPAAFRSAAPWDGTPVLLRVRRDLPRMRRTDRTKIQEVLGAAPSGPACDTESQSQTNALSQGHFHITYDGVDAGLTVADYAASLERSWNTEVDAFGWAAPPVYAANPAPGGRYHVRIDDLAPGLYGFVSPAGTYAGFVGDNPATPWNEGDGSASCMVLNRNYNGFASAPQAALDSTTAHEFNHSIQFGYGALSGPNAPDEVFVEGGATWMEDEVHDAADDNYFYLWPVFADSMGDYDSSPYGYWVTFRGFTERYGTGAADGGEQVMQDFWELTSKNAASNLTAMDAALAARGTTLADAFHAYAVAVKFDRACAGGYALPYCFEEGPAYVGVGGQTAVHGSIGAVGGNATGSVEDNYALAWVALPPSGSLYDVTLANTSSGGQLRGTVACDTGSGLSLYPLPELAGPGQSSTVAGFDPGPCSSRVAVVTNQARTSPNPTSSALRSFRVSTSAATATTRTLGVATTGSGSGTVTSIPAGINCGSDCSESYPGGSVVTLSASSSPGSSFAGWSGEGCSGTGACTVTMSQARSVSAEFALASGTAQTTSPFSGGTSGGSAGGGAATAPTQLVGIADRIAPVIARLRLSPTAFRAARSGPALATLAGARQAQMPWGPSRASPAVSEPSGPIFAATARRRLSPSERARPVFAAVAGTRMSLSLSEAASVMFHVDRLAPGRKVAGRCRPATAANRAARHCTRRVRLHGRVERGLPAGASGLRYRGRLAGQTLRPGRYRLVMRARDAAGNLSDPRGATFVILR